MVLTYFRRSPLESRLRDFVSGLPFYIGDSEVWNLGLPFYLGHDEGWYLGLPFYLAIGDKIFGIYRIAHRIGGLFVVCCSLIQVYGYWRFHVLWGFALCIEALFGMPCGWRGGAAPPGAVADVNDTAQALMITMLPVYM